MKANSLHPSSRMEGRNTHGRRHLERCSGTHRTRHLAATWERSPEARCITWGVGAGGTQGQDPDCPRAKLTAGLLRGNGQGTNQSSQGGQQTHPGYSHQAITHLRRDSWIREQETEVRGWTPPTQLHLDRSAR